MRSSKSERYNKMIEARRSEEARNLFRDAPALLDRLDAIDAERGRTCHEAVLRTRSDITGLLNHTTLNAIDRGSLILIGLRNLCHLINIARAPGAKMIEIVGTPDPADTHYGAARIAARFDVLCLSEDEYYNAARVSNHATFQNTSREAA